MKDAPKFGGALGTPVPAVDPKDLKTAFELYRRANASTNPKKVTQSRDALELARKAGASLPAVSYRATILDLLLHAPENPLGPWVKENGQLDDAVFLEAAEIAMRWMAESLSEYLPFNLDELLQRVRNHQKQRIQ
jgi:hypothetical protein